MQELEIVPISRPDTEISRLIEMTISTCPSAQTRRVYRGQLNTFLRSGLPLNREGVAAHIQALREKGRGSATLASAVAAIRKLASEAKIRGLMTADEFEQIKSISPGKQFKTRAGVWLTVDQVQEYLDLPDRSTYWGKRDACLLSLMVGCGLRREEMATLRWDRYQSREGRMCLVDVKGKGGRLRTLPVPTWAKPDVDAWLIASRELPKLEGNNKSRRVDMNYLMGGMSTQNIYTIVKEYGDRAGHNLAPHDLRRTLAKMLRKSGAALEQIQATLGHENIQTTTIYLGSTLELDEGRAVVDMLKLRAPKREEKVDPLALEPDPEATLARLQGDRGVQGGKGEPDAA